MLWGLIFLLLLTGAAWALPPEYEILIEKNPFSPERQYIPPVNGTQTGKTTKNEDLKKDLILRGTFFGEDFRVAIIEVRSGFKRRHHLEKDRFVVKVGEKIGPCEVMEIRRGEVVLGGGCRVVLRLADAPERQKPLPLNPQKVTKSPKSNKPVSFGPKPSNSAKKEEKPSSPPPNPFQKIFEKQKKRKDAGH